jgi:hypothetical protein
MDTKITVPDNDSGLSRRKLALIHNENRSTDSFIRTYIHVDSI